MREPDPAGDEAWTLLFCKSYRILSKISIYNYQRIMYTIITDKYILGLMTTQPLVGKLRGGSVYAN